MQRTTGKLVDTHTHLEINSMSFKQIKPLTSIKEQKNGIVDEAVNLSSDWYDAYIKTHSYGADALTLDITNQLAIARYEWLLSTARESILNVFSDTELHHVAISLQHELAIPNDYPLARSIADDNLVIWDSYRDSEYSILIDKLLALTPTEDMALRDIAERFWNGSHHQGVQFSKYINGLRSS